MTTWDEAKRQENLRKHGVDLALAQQFEWSTAVTEEDTSEAYGERVAATGWIGTTLYVYVYTLRGEDEDHAISLRKAEKKDYRRYEDQY